MQVDTKTVISTLFSAVEHSQALDMPYDKGISILQKHGFNNDKRFELSATDFVKAKQSGSIRNAEHYFKANKAVRELFGKL